MRKFLAFAVVLIILFLLGSLFLPVKLEIEQEFTIANNKRIVEQKLHSLAIFKEWLITEGEKPIIRDNAIYWEGTSGTLKAEILNSEEKETWEIKGVDFYENFRVTFELQEENDKSTKLNFQLVSLPTINPIRRYTYVLDKKKIEDLVRGGLLSLKKQCEAVSYERFHLSSPIRESKNDLVFCFAKHTTPTNLQTTKVSEIDSVFFKRLVKYKALDSLQTAYLQYTKWNDSIINYNVCVPLLKAPSPKQLIWLIGGKVSKIKGEFYTANYEGSAEDLPLAWDSLYSNLKDKGLSPKGFPLEQLIHKTDSIEQRKLFIQVR